MKKTIQTAALFLIFPLFSSAFNHVNNIHLTEIHPGSGYQIIFSSPHATFSKQWIDYDVYEDGVKGMRIHLKFSAYEMKGLESYIAIFFQDDYGNKLKDKNQKFYSSGGDVALYKLLNPCCDETVYDDLQLFMPYNELDLDAGNYNLTMDVDVIYKDGTLIQHLNFYDFKFTQPGGTSTITRTSSSLNATFDKMWVDYDVTEKGQKGMRIHAKFSLKNMKDVDCFLVVNFSTKSGRKLTTTNADYSSKDGLGQVAVYKSLSPGYNDAAYNDAQLFMPYSQFNLGTGSYNLTMDLDLIYPNGEVIKHLQYYDFLYENK
ncbi:MAG: hypothetical protein ACHQF0_17665 [Chitinophagales bacterium]